MTIKTPRNLETKKTMELNLALKPLRLVSQLMGLNFKGRFGRLYTFVVSLMVTIFLCASCVNLASGNVKVLTKVDSLIMWTQFVTNVIIIAVVLGACIIRPCQFLFPIQEMRQVDTVLRFLGSDISNSYLRRMQFFQISNWGLLLVILGAKDFWESVQRHSIFVFFHSLYYSYSVSSFIIIDFLFIDYLMVIGTRFSKLNQLLSMNLERGRPTLNLNFLRVAGRNGACKDCSIDISSIEKLRLIHHDLCGISKKVNGSFGIQLLVTTAVSVVMITGQLYEAYHFINSDVSPVEIAAEKIIWISFHVGRLFYISWACNRTSNEASLTSSLIHKVPVHHMSNSANIQIQHFSQQLISENLKFTACGFFNVDFALLCTIVGVVTTYLVILIQMDLKSNCSY